MKLEYSKEYCVTSGMFDEYKRMKPYSILDILQSIAGIHADILGIGTPYCEAHNYGWIMARQEVHIYKSPYVHQTLKVTTFPHEPKSRMEFIREYRIESLDGELLIAAQALWVLYNFETGKMMPTLGVYPEGEFVLDSNFENKPSKPLNASKEGSKVGSYTVVKSDIDIYHHMNNAKYGDTMFNYCGIGAGEISSFTISYASQAKLNEAFDIYKVEVDDKIYVTGCNESGVIFTSEIKKQEYK